MKKDKQWDRYEKVVSEYEMLELWHGLERAVQRKDLFWIFFYADRLSTVWSEIRARQNLPVI